jgi:hypothetical protein
LRNIPDAGALDKVYALLERAVASENRDAKFHLAALLCDVARGPRAAIQGAPWISWRRSRKKWDFDPYFFEIRAAAQAMLGNFAEAQADQNLALKKAENSAGTRSLRRSRLDNYMASKYWTGNLFSF